MPLNSIIKSSCKKSLWPAVKMENKKRRLPFMAEGVRNNTVPPLFTEYLTINRLTKCKDFYSVTGTPVGAYCNVRAAAQKGIH